MHQLFTIGLPSILSLPVCRLTAATVLGQGQPVWINRMRLPPGREIEARPHNVLTLASREIAFQVVPLEGANSVAWDLEAAQRLRLELRDEHGAPKFEQRMRRRDPKHWVQVR